MKPKRVALYARVSTLHDQKPELQIEELRRFADARGWKVEHEIIDHGFSGGTDNRPGFKTLMRLVHTRDVDAVAVVKLDRLFRSLKHLVAVLDELSSLDVVFVATRDNLDYSTPSGRFFVQVLGSLAEFERELIRERTMMGLEHARAKGKVLGRPKTRDDAAIVSLRSQGLSYSAIQSRLGVSRGAVCRALRSGSKTSSEIGQKHRRNRLKVGDSE